MTAIPNADKPPVAGEHPIVMTKRRERAQKMALWLNRMSVPVEDLYGYNDAQWQFVAKHAGLRQKANGDPPDPSETTRNLCIAFMTPSPGQRALYGND